MYWERIQAWFEVLPLRQKAVDWLVETGTPVYLVGGSVRDALLGRDAEDLDLAVDGDALRLSRRLADYLHGAYVPLDDERDVGRVVVGVGGRQMHIDLAGLRAEGILADLAARDFTINAMAVPLNQQDGELLDPTGGREDLYARLLRVAYSRALEDDPLRVLRGLRLRAKLGFEIEPVTEELLHEYAPLLRRVSAERIREEWLQMLYLDNAADSYEYSRRLGVLPLVFPVFGQRPQAQEEAGHLLRYTDALVEAVLHGPDGDSVAHRQLAARIGSAWGALRPYWRQEVSSGHHRVTLVKLAAQFGAPSLGAECARQAGHRLRLSRNEVRLLHRAVGACEYLLGLDGEAELTPLEVYRFYRRFGDAGVDGALLAWARVCGADPRSDQADLLTARVAGLVRAWFGQQATWVSPAPLLSGRDLIERLDLAPGPLVGRLIGQLAEAQVQQRISTAEEALDYARDWLEREQSAPLGSK